MMMMMMMKLVCKSICQSQSLIANNRTLIRAYATKKIIFTNLDSSEEFKISFLKNECGLSGKSLIRACKCLHFDSSDQRPNSVLELLRTFGFPLSSITKIIAHYPFILQKYHHQEVMKPKLDFLLSISQSQSQAEVVAIVTKNPLLLTRSLTNNLIPSLNLLNSITGSYLNTLSVLKYNPYILTQNIPKSFLLNTQFLLTLGVPHTHILKLLRCYGTVLGTPHEKLRKFALRLKDMGFDLKSSYFCNGIYTLCFVPQSSWESRFVLFRSFGFSDQDILSMFKKMPRVMIYSERAITEKMEFFLNKLQWTQFKLLSCPTVLTYSLEKRIIPRCSVLQVLVSKNCSRDIYMSSTILVMSEREFFEDFVIPYKDDIPEVMEAYRGKLRFDNYTFGQKAQLV